MTNDNLFIMGNVGTVENNDDIYMFTIDVDGYIINGHHRYDAMKIFKFKTVLVRLLNLKANQILASGEQYKDLLENMKFESIDFSKSKVPSFQPLLGMKHKNRKDTVEIILNQA